MATETVTSPQLDAQRLECLRRICCEMASKINTARKVLREGAEDACTAYLVADCLDSIGWMAERAGHLAGDTTGGECTDAEGWMLATYTAELVRSTESGVVHG